MRVRHTEVFMVRHGQTDSNAAGLFHGVTDVPLNKHGLRQAELVAQRVQVIDELRSLHSSPLQRALATAQAISTGIGLTPRLHPGLAEMDFGAAEGLVLNEMLERYADITARFLDLDDDEARFPNGESRREFHIRVRETLDHIVSSHAGERILVVAHGGVIGSAVSQILGDNPNDWQRYAVDNCSVTHIELASSGPITHLLGDVVHLEQLRLDDDAPAAGR
ncbi:MAG TPA: histidine phosphatase family protein [Thermomicrobiales bacterium]|nr:histidine phosphatase family protein [Thermomicrobiales bacterium]